MDQSPEGTEYPKNSENLDDWDCPGADRGDEYYKKLGGEMDTHWNKTYNIDASKKILVLLPIQLRRILMMIMRKLAQILTPHYDIQAGTLKPDEKGSSRRAISDESGFQQSIRLLKSQFWPSFKTPFQWGKTVRCFNLWEEKVVRNILRLGNFWTLRLSSRDWHYLTGFCSKKSSIAFWIFNIHILQYQ